MKRMLLLISILGLLSQNLFGQTNVVVLTEKESSRKTDRSRIFSQEGHNLQCLLADKGEHTSGAYFVLDEDSSLLWYAEVKEGKLDGILVRFDYKDGELYANKLSYLKTEKELVRVHYATQGFVKDMCIIRTGIAKIQFGDHSGDVKLLDNKYRTVAKVDLAKLMEEYQSYNPKGNLEKTLVAY